MKDLKETKKKTLAISNQPRKKWQPCKPKLKTDKKSDKA